MSHLYIIELGGTRSESLFEVHLVHAMVAPDERTMIEKCRDKFLHQLQAAHIDGWVALPVEQDDPARPFEPNSRCWLLECGHNSVASLREQHDYRFLQAGDGREAITRMREELPGWHIDSVIDVDRLALERGWRLIRPESNALPPLHQVARYIRLDRMASNRLATI